MEHQEYDLLLENLEKERAIDPIKFERKVQGFIRLGFFFFVGLALFFFLVMAAPVLLWIFFGVVRGQVYLFIAGAAGLYSVIRVLFLRYEEPLGEKLTNHDAPELFRRVDEIGKLMGAPPISSIALTEDLNAFASAVPKLFLLGKPDLHVSIGVPLLAFLPPEEVDEVIAHELAHHTNRDTDVSLKVYRVLGVWRILAENGGSWIDWSPIFARWYYPRLAGMSSVLSRDTEFAADRMAARVVGNDVAIRAHFRLAFAATQRSEQMLKRMRKSIEKSEEPISNWVEQLLEVASESVEIKPGAIEAEGRRVSLTGDSHPTLRERIEAIGGKLDPQDTAGIADLVEILQAPLGETGVDRYLGGSDSAISQKINLNWQREQLQEWKSCRLERAFSQKVVEEYQEKQVPLSPFEHINYAYHLGKTGKREEAIEYLGKRLKEFPDHLNIKRMYAMMCFAVDQELAEPLITELSQYPAFAFEADEARYELMQLRGRTREAEELAKKLQDGAQAWYRKAEELLPWRDTSIVSAPCAAQAETEFVCSVLRKYSQVESAYLARTSLTDLPGLSRRVLLITINMGLVYKSEEEQLHKLSSPLFQELEPVTSVDIRILSNKDSLTKLAVKKMASFQIYPTS